MPDRVKVLFDSVLVRDDADLFSSGEWYFIASVDGQPVPASEADRRQIFRAVEGEVGRIVLPQPKWSAIVDVTNKVSFRLQFRGRDKDLIYDDDLGDPIDFMVPGIIVPGWTNRAWVQGRTPLSNHYFTLVYELLLEVEGKFSIQPPGEVFACREHLGSGRCTTVLGGTQEVRLEVHPVRPVPAALPTRPAWTAVVLAARNDGDTNIIPFVSPLNEIPNPSVIPVLSPPGAGAAPANAPPRATANNAARIEATYYSPVTMTIADPVTGTRNDERIEWFINNPASRPEVRFLGGNTGLRVRAYGVFDAANPNATREVVLEARLRGAPLASFRAIVAPIRQIWYRANILNGPNAASRPRTSPAQVQEHIYIANCFLRQMGLELVPDPDTTRRDDAHATTDLTNHPLPAIFRIAVTANVTRNINGAIQFPRCTGLNANHTATRPVLNIAYVHSARFWINGAWRQLRGKGTDRDNSPAGANVQDPGTPTSSWYRPNPPARGCGVPPDNPPGNPVVQMTLLPGAQRTHPPHLQRWTDLFAFFMTSATGDPATQAGQMILGKTIAHELGHVLNLHHRSVLDPTTGLPVAGPDGLGGHPARENVMCQSQPANLGQDLDIIQTLAARQSRLVPP